MTVADKGEWFFPGHYISRTMYWNSSVHGASCSSSNKISVSARSRNCLQIINYPQSYFYLLQSYVIWNTTSIPYTPPSFSFTCTESTLSPAPSLVENFTINSYSIHGTQITLDMDWSPPSVPNGELAPYNICISGEPLGPDEELLVISRGRTCTSQRESVSCGNCIYLAM